VGREWAGEGGVGGRGAGAVGYPPLRCRDAEGLKRRHGVSERSTAATLSRPAPTFVLPAESGSAVARSLSRISDGVSAAPPVMDCISPTAAATCWAANGVPLAGM